MIILWWIGFISSVLSVFANSARFFNNDTVQAHMTDNVNTVVFVYLFLGLPYYCIIPVTLWLLKPGG